jgi:hypothetical protein
VEPPAGDGAPLTASPNPSYACLSAGIEHQLSASTESIGL